MKDFDPSGTNPGRQVRPRILIVDDDEAVRYLCAEALGEYEILQAGNGRAAMDLLAGSAVDIILTDVMMPEMTGLELLEAVKGREPNQIVLVMTSFGEKETILRALKGNADDFVEKPIDRLMVQSAVARALEKGRLREELFHLKQMDRLKSEFLGLVSHKLKTPVTIISLAAQIVMEGSGENTNPSFRKNAEAINEQASYLVMLIEELLRFSEVILQERDLVLEPVDPGEVLLSCADGAREAASLKGVELKIHAGGSLPTLRLDRNRIRFALQALLDNALKFTPKGGSVTARVEAGEEEVRFVVRDTGVGIPPEEQAKVFEKFYQIDPDYTGQVRGFGLGLYYARRFTGDHGGTIELQSAPGEGTAAVIRLPAPAPAG